MGFDDFIDAGHFDAVDGDGTVGDVFTSLAFRLVNVGIDEPVDDVLVFVGNVDGRHLPESLFQFVFRQVSNAAVIQGFRNILGFLQSFRAVDEGRDFFSQAALSQSFFRFRFNGFGQGVDFFFAEEGKILQVFYDVGVILIEPELVEFEGRRLFRIEPNGTAGRFTEFRAVRLQHQGDGQAKGFSFAAMHLADRIDPGRNVPPLIGTADLKLDVVL